MAREYERKTNRPYEKLTTKEKLKKRIGKSFKIIDQCLKNGKGIKPLQLAVAKWVIESDLVKAEKQRQSEIIPPYEEKLLKEFKEGNDGNK